MAARKITGESSTVQIVLFSFVVSFLVLGSALLVQWFVYTDWLHRTGPLRIVGSVLAALVTFMFVFRWRAAENARQLEMLHRLETIRQMNDRIRNALQAIECATYVSNPGATGPVLDAVNIIDNVLRDVNSDPILLPSDLHKLNATRTAYSGAKRHSA